CCSCSEPSFFTVGLAAAVGQQRANGQDDECQDADDGAHIVVLAVDGQLVQPGDQQVGAAGGGGQVGDGVAARQQVDDVEVVDVAGEGGDQVRGGDVEHIGQGDAEEGLHRIGAVHGGGLVQIGGDVLQHAGQLQQGVGHAHPDVDQDDGDPGPGRVGEEGQALAGGDEAHLAQQHVDGALRLQHGAHDQQGDEHGHGAGQHEAETPEAFGLGLLAV